MKIWDLIADANLNWQLRINVARAALATARTDFQLRMPADVIAVIAQFEADDYRELETLPLRDPVPGATPGTDVFSYDFFWGRHFGYLAFVRNTSNTLWVIKSFKRNTGPDPRSSSPFANIRL